MKKGVATCYCCKLLVWLQQSTAGQVTIYCYKRCAKKKLGFLGYCTYKVGKNPFKIFHGKLGVYMLLLVEVTIYSYYNWYAKNGSHKLTVGFLMNCTYKVRKSPLN